MTCRQGKYANGGTVQSFECPHTWARTHVGPDLTRWECMRCSAFRWRATDLNFDHPTTPTVHVHVVTNAEALEALSRTMNSEQMRQHISAAMKRALSLPPVQPRFPDFPALEDDDRERQDGMLCRLFQRVTAVWRRLAKA